MTPTLQILCSDALTELRKLPSDSVHCCVTSPPYWGLRDYKMPGQIGLEPTPEEWCARLVEVFREVRRVLHPRGTLWVNCGDAYYGSWANYGGGDRGAGKQRPIVKGSSAQNPVWEGLAGYRPAATRPHPSLKAKDVIGLPWLLAFALRADGWYLRQDIIWAKPNPMPESVTDRCTKSHEYIFLLSKSQAYFYDQEAVREPSSGNTHPRIPGNTRPAKGAQAFIDGDHRQRTKAGLLAHAQRKRTESGSGIKNNDSFNDACAVMLENRNKRSVWTIATEPYPDSHFATFPTNLVKPCVLAGTSARGVCPECGAPWARVIEPDDQRKAQLGEGWHQHEADIERGQRNGKPALGGYRTIGWAVGCNCEADGEPIPATVLDPFLGSGTTAAVALELGRSAIGIELSPDYCQQARQRCAKVTAGLALA